MLNTQQLKLLRQYAFQQPPLLYKHNLVCCASMGADNLIEAIKLFKSYYNRCKQCECGCYTAWTSGRYINNKLRWYCFNHQPPIEYSIKRYL